LSFSSHAALKAYDIKIEYFENNHLITSGRMITRAKEQVSLVKNDNNTITSLKVLPTTKIIRGSSKIHVEIDLEVKRGINSKKVSTLKTELLLNSGEKSIFQTGVVNGMSQEIQIEALEI